MFFSKNIKKMFALNNFLTIYLLNLYRKSYEKQQENLWHRHTNISAGFELVKFDSVVNQGGQLKSNKITFVFRHYKITTALSMYSVWHLRCVHDFLTRSNCVCSQERNSFFSPIHFIRSLSSYRLHHTHILHTHFALCFA